MAKRGPKSGFNEKVQATILRLLKEGKTEDEIAAIIGVCRRTLANWKGKHPELLYAVRESKLVADELIEMSLFRKALGYSHPETKVFIHEGCPITEDVTKHYPPDTQAAMFWLRNRQPARWREKNEADVNVQNNVSMTQLTDEQIEAKIAALLSRGKGESH